MANILKFPGFANGEELGVYNYVNADKYFLTVSDGQPGVENGSTLSIQLTVPGTNADVQTILWQIAKASWSDELVDKVDKAIRENSRVPNTVLDMEELISGLITINAPGSCGLITFSSPTPEELN